MTSFSSMDVQETLHHT